MPTFTNQATMTYNNGITLTSNVATGEIIDVLSISKSPLYNQYSNGQKVSYVISLVNSGGTELSGITVTDNLGGPTVGTAGYPLTYIDDSAKYYINGVLQTAPLTVTAGPPLVFSGITVPAGGNAIIAYETSTNQYSPLNLTGQINNTATATGAGITTTTADATVFTENAPNIEIVKSISPNPVVENGQVTYTFTINNFGNTPVTTASNAVITDNFNPILSNVTATLDGAPLTLTTDYTYNTATGAFATNSGLITVPPATYTTDPVTGVVTTTPGQRVLSVTGTI